MHPGTPRHLSIGLLMFVCVAHAITWAATEPGETPPGAAPATEPALPAWIGKDPAQWPQILCSNEIHYIGSNEYSEGAGASLMRLPSGVIVGATARHVVAADFALTDYARKVRSYFLYSHADPKKKVTIGKPAVDLAAVEKVDCVALTLPNQRGPWPAEVLNARETPLENGEAIYLIGVPSSEKKPQIVYKGVVVAHERVDFIFQVDGRIERTLGLSGSPILDAQGRLAAVYTGHLTEQNHPDKTDLVGVESSRMLELIKIPADQANGAATMAGTRPVNDGNAEADAALRGARLFVDNKRYAPARDRLQAVIKAYPNTPAASEATNLLKQIEGK